MKRTLPPIPGNVDPGLLGWMRAVESQLLALPQFSISSTSNGPNSSGVTGAQGTILVDVGSSATRLWQKTSASTSTTGWSAFSWI